MTVHEGLYVDRPRHVNVLRCTGVSDAVLALQQVIAAINLLVCRLRLRYSKICLATTATFIHTLFIYLRFTKTSDVSIHLMMANTISAHYIRA